MENELEVVNAEILKSLYEIRNLLTLIAANIQEGTRQVVISNELVAATLRRMETLLEQRLP